MTKCARSSNEKKTPRFAEEVVAQQPGCLEPGQPGVEGGIAGSSQPHLPGQAMSLQYLSNLLKRGKIELFDGPLAHGRLSLLEDPVVILIKW